MSTFRVGDAEGGTTYAAPSIADTNSFPVNNESDSDTDVSITVEVLDSSDTEADSVDGDVVTTSGQRFQREHLLVTSPLTQSGTA
mmetsp:Transcript_29459/g.77229  ORF Transcript_29459/g.77229 Transcript_29459/m.77229 type:complete len:85 (+) Transcript_29459:192-446(+)